MNDFQKFLKVCNSCKLAFYNFFLFSQQVTESDQAMIDLSANKVRMAVDIISLIKILEEKNKIAMYLAKHNSDLNAVKALFKIKAILSSLY